MLLPGFGWCANSGCRRLAIGRSDLAMTGLCQGEALPPRVPCPAALMYQLFGLGLDVRT